VGFPEGAPKLEPERKTIYESRQRCGPNKGLWSRMVGRGRTSFGKNPPFLPEGSVFKRIVNGAETDGGQFGVVDLYAAYLLQQATAAMGFGRGAAKQSRRQTRFLFLMVVVDLFRDVLSRASKPLDQRAISSALVKVLEDEAAKTALLERAAEVIDGYFTQNSDDSVFTEPAYLNSFNADLNAFLKWEKLGKPDGDTPRLKSALSVNKAVMGKAMGGTTDRKVIMAAVERSE
jgi:hypothetical protein